ncbi:nucleoside-diphosphate kinase [Desulfovibrio oxyclinae]|uniref:nucleoside-diphosphate kinase n=1 Tax=Desulfovibrio oxyclinae TaxID=63560 RepID=UPI0003741E1B|nr:nucleoside-diphosphate kinase [Desulfovibrio oxyclinae]
MTVETTLSIIKPDAVAAGNIGAILQMISDAGLKIKAMKMVQMSQKEAEGFYAVHKERPFFGELVEFMTSGPAVVSILEGENAIARYRELMGATNPEQAEEGTIRKNFATNIQNNAVHGSDAPETAAVETAYFFSSIEQVN